MTQDPLQQFAIQLHAWATDELQKKPGPFRAVELFPPLLGNTDNISPPVVFWINKESHLAGGVILLPKDNPSEVMESGREICAALGLNSYYTWGISEVAAWGTGSPSGRLWTEPIPDTAMHETNTFRELLTLLLQNMQNRFFSCQPQLPILSSAYLTNLLHNCIETSVVCASTPPSTSTSEKIGGVNRSRLACVVMQMLALHSQTAMPGKIDQDRLTSDLRNGIERLPAPLLSALRLDSGAADLPDSVRLKLHHLYRRLQQIGPDLLMVMPGAIKRLLKFWSESAKLSELPAPLKKNRSTLTINTDRYNPEMSVSIEIATPPFTAATALLRFLQSAERRHPHQLSDLLDLKKPVTVEEVIGNLSDRSRPSVPEQRELNTLLRRSWPNRQLKISPTSPRWVWQAVHLLGLLQGTPYGVLNLPADWLWAPYGDQFFNLLVERVNLCRISPAGNGQIQIKFNLPTKNRQVTIDAFNNDIRITDKQNTEVTRSDLLLALSLPTDVYELLRNGELEPARNIDQSVSSVELFLKSSLGRGLWQILSPKKKLPKTDKLIPEIIRTGLPLPGEKVLDALVQLQGKPSYPDKATIDRELAAWLGSAALNTLRPKFIPTLTKSDALPKNNPGDDIITNLLESGEVLTFPADYLYDFPEKGRRNYFVPGLLSIHETFFNTVTMLTSEGESLSIEGLEAARALELISTIKIGEVELPVDEHHVETILNRYLKDLHKLYEQIQSSAANSEFTAKDDLVDQIWKKLPVPPLNKLRDC